MVSTQEFRWDVLTHPRVDDWFDEMREQGWRRDIGAPGIRKADGTIAYRFFHVGPADAGLCA